MLTKCQIEVLTKGWSKVKKAERRGLFTRLAKRMKASA